MRLFVLSVLICIACSCKSYSAESTKILVFGDSLSAAYNISPEKGWVTLLENELIAEQTDVVFTNASISGETTSGGLVRFADQINKTQPDILILELGANDGLRGSSLNTMLKNLQTMIEIGQQNNVIVLLAGMHIPPNYGRTYTQKFDQIYIDLAKIDQVTLIPFLLEGVATKPEFIQRDGIHPNEKAQPIISSVVKRYLGPLLRIAAE